jgi:hypothetical protein
MLKLPHLHLRLVVGLGCQGSRGVNIPLSLIPRAVRTSCVLVSGTLGSYKQCVSGACLWFLLKVHLAAAVDRATAPCVRVPVLQLEPAEPVFVVTCPS